MHAVFTRLITRKVNLRYISHPSVSLPEYPDLDREYLSNPANTAEVSTNISNRKGIGNVSSVQELETQLKNASPTSEDYTSLKKRLWAELSKIPNRTHPIVAGYKDEPKVVGTIGEPRLFDFKPREFHEIAKRLNMARTEQLGNVVGSRGYYVLGELAELESALIRFTLSNLRKRNFKLISVPDVLDRRIIEGCGMDTTGERTQVYSLVKNKDGLDLCLSGTSEMAIAGFLANKTIPIEDLPLRIMTVSRCYRAETSSTAEERGIYRVHQFTKVEMFVVSEPNKSEQILEELRTIQEENFSALGLHLRTLDMPPHELGAPAYRKYDVEAWLPGRKMFGEVSSCSNCTDYQSRRLNIKYGENCFAHTLNGTACAIPRMLIALIETYQNDNGTIDVPKELQKYMRDKTKMSRQIRIPELKLIKNKK